MLVPVDVLRQHVVSMLTDPLSERDAERVAEVLLWADMSGISTQGVIKLTGTEPLQNITPTGEMRAERETPLSCLLDAGANPAILACQDATDRAISKAGALGFAIIGVHNTWSSSGALAFYADRIAAAGLIGVVVARSPASTAAFGGIDPIFGTNPIAFGFPAAPDPIVFDMATSALTWYGLVLARTRGDAIPADVAIDASGEPTTDPAHAMLGALLPFDRGFKGAGLAMAVEILAGPLVGAAFCAVEGEWGNTIIALDPGLLVEGDQFKANCSDLIATIKASRRREGDSVRLPGERARFARDAARESGMVDVDDSVLSALDIKGGTSPRRLSSAGDTFGSTR